MNRRRLASGIAGLLALTGALVGCAQDSGTAACGSDESVVRSANPVFGSVAAADDPHLTRLADAARGWGLGPVVGGVAFDYGQWLSLGGSSVGLMTWTKRDPVISFLDKQLGFTWGLRQAAVPHAWTADADTFFQLELSPRHRLWLSAYRLGDGHRDWCAVVGTRPTTQSDPYGTAFVPDGGLLVLARGTTGSVLTRLDERSGKATWTHPISGIDQGDFIGSLGDGLALVGGRASYQLGDPQTPQPAGATLRAIDTATGTVRWSYAGAQVHVVGISGGLVLLQRLSAKGAELVALDDAGTVLWTRPADRLGNDFAIAGGTVVANTGHAFVGLDPRTGRRSWATPYPKVPQYLPYGFVLAAQPVLDARHLLIAGTGGLHELDIRTGAIRTHDLPRSGINTTFWPYQLVLTDGLLAVVTNTGAVVLARS